MSVCIDSYIIQMQTHMHIVPVHLSSCPNLYFTTFENNCIDILFSFLNINLNPWPNDRGKKMPVSVTCKPVCGNL